MKRVVLLEKCPEGKITIENWFVDLLYEVEIVIDNKHYPNSILFFKNDEFIFHQDYQKNIFWVSNDNVWSMLYSFNYYDDLEIGNFIKNVIEKHFKISISTPQYLVGQ